MPSKLPTDLIVSLSGVAGFDPVTFEAVHADTRQVTSIRVNPPKWEGKAAPEGQDEPAPGLGAAPGGGADWHQAKLEKVPWSSFGYYLAERPSFTFDPLFHAGAYYVQEASSMFVEQALRQTTDLSRPLRVLDLCAAPGGKSTLVQSLLSADSLLVSNEVIRTRVNILQENMVKWGAPNVIITQNDPRDFQRLENYFDVIVVDAPCSGSGLFRREPEAIGEWSPENVQLCRQRQQRILADCWPALRQGGLLIYSTCSYSREEDEDILDWVEEDLQASGCRLQVEEGWNIVETMGRKGGYGYRFYPDKLKGEGFFLAAVRKEDGGSFHYPRNKRSAPEKLTRQEQELVSGWTRPELPLVFFRHQEYIGGLPEPFAADLSLLQANCYLKKAGVLMGKPSAKELIPEHDLALSVILSGTLPAVNLSQEDAIQYLRKEEIKPEGAVRGWALARYQGCNLGWMKVLPNRINNYYPKEWRILKRDL